MVVRSYLIVWVVVSLVIYLAVSSEIEQMSHFDTDEIMDRLDRMAIDVTGLRVMLRSERRIRKRLENQLTQVIQNVTTTHAPASKVFDSDEMARVRSELNVVTSALQDYQMKYGELDKNFQGLHAYCHQQINVFRNAINSKKRKTHLKIHRLELAEKRNHRFEQSVCHLANDSCRKDEYLDAGCCIRSALLQMQSDAETSVVIALTDMAKIDECASTPCRHGGTCVDGLNKYACICHAGYTGVECETDIDECVSTPCQHSGKCVDGINIYTCTCLNGYTGVECETDIDECASSPCQHGSCIDGLNKYTCDCERGFIGRNCADQCEDFLVSGDVTGVPDSAITASSSYSTCGSNGCAPHQARLDNTAGVGVWYSGSAKVGEYIQVRLKGVSLVRGVVTQGDGIYREWVTQYHVLYSQDGSEWSTATGEGGLVNFPGNTDINSKVTNFLDPPVMARYVRISVQAWKYHIAMRFDVIGCPLSD